MFEHALALDPHYADAHTWLGMTYLMEWLFFSQPQPQLLTRAVELAQHALTLDDSLPDAHSLLGYLYLWQKRPAEAIAEGERAIGLDPNSARAYLWLAEIQTLAGHPEKAPALVQQAMRSGSANGAMTRRHWTGQPRQPKNSLP